MLTMNIQCEVSPERTVTLQLPDQVQPGRHELVLVVDAAPAAESLCGEAEGLMKLAGSVPAFGNLDGVALQRALRDEWP